MNIEGLVTTYSVADNARYVDSIFYAIKNPRAPFLNAMTPGKEITATKLEWWEDVRLPSKSELVAAHVKDSGELKLVSAFGVRAGTIIKVGDVLYRATSVNSSTGAVGVVAINTDANASQGATAIFLNAAQLEGANRQNSDFAASVRRYNVTQIISDYVDISGTQAAVNRESGKEALVDREVARKLNRIYLQLARAIWMNPLVDAEDASVPRVFGGIMDLISRYGYAPNAAQFSIDNFDAFLRELDQERGSVIEQAWMNPLTLSKFLGLLPQGAQVVVDMQNPVIGSVPRAYISKSGYEVMLNADSNIPADKIVVVRPQDAILRPLATRQFAVRDADDGSDAVRKTILGEYTLELNPAGQCGIFTISQ